MKHLKELTAVIVAISLVLNIFLVSKIMRVEEQVNQLSHEQYSMINRIENQSSNIGYMLDEFKREQSWISSIRMDIDTEGLPEKPAALDFEWQVKELMVNSEVFFHYKYGLEKEYRKVAAIDQGNGLFKAKIAMNLPLEPEWHTSFSFSSNQLEMERTIEERNHQEYQKYELSFYITVESDQLLKSSNIQTEHIGYLGTSYYGMIEAYGHQHDSGYHITVNRPSYYGETNMSLTDVYLVKYQNGKLLEEEKLLLNEYINDGYMEMDEVVVFEKSSSDEKFDFSRLLIRVVYSDGAVFERVIYGE